MQHHRSVVRNWLPAAPIAAPFISMHLAEANLHDCAHLRACIQAWPSVHVRYILIGDAALKSSIHSQHQPTLQTTTFHASILFNQTPEARCCCCRAVSNAQGAAAALSPPGSTGPPRVLLLGAGPLPASRAAAAASLHAVLYQGAGYAGHAWASLEGGDGSLGGAGLGNLEASRADGTAAGGAGSGAGSGSSGGGRGRDADEREGGEQDVAVPAMLLGFTHLHAVPAGAL